MINNNWDKISIGDLCNKITDGAHHSPKSVPEGKPMLSVKDMRYNGFDYSNARQISVHDFDKLVASSCKPLKNDVLIAKDGSYLKHAFVCTEEKDEVVLSSIAILRPNESLVNSHFLAYALKSPYLKKVMANYVSGVAIPRIILDDFKKIKIPIPSIKVQERIVEILMSYDSLIDNLNSRITNLQEIAEQYFKEWFVRMRFPDYNKTVFRKGIPEGWEVKNLAEIANILMGQSPKSEFYNSDKIGLPFHQGVGSYGKLYPRHDIYCSVAGREAQEGDILFSVRAPVGRLNIADRKLIIGRGLAAISDKNENNFFLWELLKYYFNKEDIIGNGAIFNSVGKKELENFKIIYPTKELIERFETLARPIHKEIDNFYQQINTLKKTRDLLLPRIISGKLKIKLEKEKSIKLEKAVTPFYQKQILAHIIKKQEEHNVAQGEMVLAKNAYLLEAIYGVETGFKWKNWHYGTYDGKIRKLIYGRDQFFKTKNVGPKGYPVLVLGENKDKILDKKYHNPIFDQAEEAMEELLEIYSHYPSGKERSRKIELLNTTVKSIADQQSTQFDIIFKAFKDWKTPKADYPTKAMKFKKTEIRNCIDFIISKGWDKILIS